MTSDVTSVAACAASAWACASSSFACSPAYASGSQAIPKETAKNLPSASAHTGTGELLSPVMAHSVTVRAVAPEPTGRSINLAARAWPPGRRSSVLPGVASSASTSQAVVSIGPPCAA